MNSKRKPSISLILSINLIFCALTSHASHNYYNPPSSTYPPFPPTTNPPFPPTTNPPTPPTMNPPTPPTMNPTCPRDALQLGVCVNLLGDLLGIIIGNPPTQPCCSLIAGLIDLEAAICLCTAIRASVLGINLNINLAITLLLNVCGRNFPSGFICPVN